jgi:hypothetical protein
VPRKGVSLTGDRCSTNLELTSREVINKATAVFEDVMSCCEAIKDMRSKRFCCVGSILVDPHSGIARCVPGGSFQVMISKKPAQNRLESSLPRSFINRTPLSLRISLLRPGVPATSPRFPRPAPRAAAPAVPRTRSRS